jgi:hypothetical protein
LAELVHDADREVRLALFGRLGLIAGDPAALDRLAGEIRPNDGALREALLRALDVENKAGELTVRAPAVGNRWRVIEELADLPEAGRLQGLDDALHDVDRPAQHRLLRALGRRASGDLVFQDVLLRAVKGPSAVAALRATAQAAAAMKAPNRMLAAVVEAARSPDALLREEALRALASSDLTVEGAVLAESLSHPAAAVRIQAALALWRRGDKSGEKLLLAALRDPDLGAQVQAVLRK